MELNGRQNNNFVPRRDIQRLRGISVLLVVFYHSDFLFSGGYLGVDVFFTISGYVITEMLLREASRPGGIQLSQFYYRRFKRLYPALFTLVIVTVLSSLFVFSPFGQVQRISTTAIAALFGAGNIAISRLTGSYFDSASELNPLLHVWSLGVEEQFYFVYPAVLLLIARCSKINFQKTFRWTVILLSAVSFVGAEIASAVEGNSKIVNFVFGFYGPLGRVWQFGAGVLIALIPTSRIIAKYHFQILIKIIGASLILISGIFTSHDVYSNRYALVPIFGASLYILAGDIEIFRLKKMSTQINLERVGDFSYSIYLWHWPIISTLSVVFGETAAQKIAYAALSIIPAVASYYFIEKPIRSKQTVSRTEWRCVATTALVALVFFASVSTSLITKQIIPQRVKDNLGDYSMLHAAAARGCHFDSDNAVLDISACGWNVGSNGDPVYLVGDSNAEQFSEATIVAAENIGRPVYIFTGSSCPLLVDVELVPPTGMSKDLWDHCRSYVERTVAWLKSSKSGLIFIASLDEYWWNDSIAIIGVDGNEVTDKKEKIEIYSAALEKTVRLLHPFSKKIVLVQSIPTYSRIGWDPNKCSVLTMAERKCPAKMKFDEVENLQKLSREALLKIGQKLNIEVLDLRNRYCDQAYCSTRINGKNTYRDALHISVSESIAVADYFANYMNQ